MTQRRILHIASGDLWAGAEAMLYQLVREQQRDPDLDISVILLNEGLLANRLRALGVRTTVLPEGELSSVQLALRICKHVLAATPQVIHTHRRKENLIGAIAARVASVPVCLRTVHGAPEHQPPLWRIDKRLAGYLDRFAARHMQTAAIFVSHELAEKLRETLRPRHSAVITNGIQIAVALERLHSENGLATTNVCWVGRLAPVKRPELFLESASLLVRQDRSFKFFIFGDGPERSACEAYIEANGLADNVEMLGFRDDVDLYLPQMHFLLLTSDHEGLPLVLLEAMASGVVIVARNVGGIPHVLEDGITGALLDAADAAAFAATVRRLSADSRQREAIRLAALKRVTTAFSVERTAREYKELYLTLLARPNT